jgi:hypothetical protein
VVSISAGNFMMNGRIELVCHLLLQVVINETIDSNKVIVPK